MNKRTLVIAAVIVVLVGAAALVRTQLPAIGAGALLHPARRAVTVPTPPGCGGDLLRSADVDLALWRCPARGERRGTIVYLHGVADNRASGTGVIQRFTAAGFAVAAYDSRAHCGSGGDFCTYGFYEKDDLRRVIDTVEEPVVLLGTSLGAAVALQHAPRDRRVAAVIAAETFSDIRTVAAERAPFVFTGGAIEASFALAERQARFDAGAVSPLAAAAQISVPVLLIHGEDDEDTPPDHSKRVFAALRGPKRLMLVPGAGHNASLTGEVWNEIARWLDNVIPRQE